MTTQAELDAFEAEITLQRSTEPCVLRRQLSAIGDLFRCVFREHAPVLLLFRGGNRSACERGGGQGEGEGQDDVDHDSLPLIALNGGVLGGSGRASGANVVGDQMAMLAAGLGISLRFSPKRVVGHESAQGVRPVTAVA